MRRWLWFCVLVGGCDCSFGWPGFDGPDRDDTGWDDDDDAIGTCGDRAPLQAVELDGWVEAVRLGQTLGPVQVDAQPWPVRRIAVAVSGADVEVDGTLFWLAPRQAGTLRVTVVATDYCSVVSRDLELSVSAWSEDLAVVNATSAPLWAELDGMALADGLSGVGDYAPMSAGPGTLRVGPSPDRAVVVPLDGAVAPRTAVAWGSHEVPSVAVLDELDVAPPSEPGRVTLQTFNAILDEGTFDVIDLDAGVVVLGGVPSGHESSGTAEVSAVGARLGLDLDGDGAVDRALPSLDGRVLPGDAVRLVIGAPDGAGVGVQSLLSRPRTFEDRQRAVLAPGFRLERSVAVRGCGAAVRVDVAVALEHEAGGGVRVTLRAPSGVERVLQPGDLPEDAADGLSWPLDGVDDGDLLSDAVDGTWTLVLDDRAAVAGGWFAGWSVTPRCLP